MVLCDLKNRQIIQEASPLGMRRMLRLVLLGIQAPCSPTSRFAEAKVSVCESRASKTTLIVTCDYSAYATANSLPNVGRIRPPPQATASGI